MSQGDVGSSYLPICTHLKAVGDTALGGRGQGAYGSSHLHWEGLSLHKKVGCGMPAKLNTDKFPSGQSLKNFCTVFGESFSPGSME